jgi:transcriptional regulator with GAF, ATPase, and Fis domain
MSINYREAQHEGVRMSADPSTELLHTISEVLDVRSVFPRVSEIANHVLPHDWLGLVFHDHADRVTLQARSAKSFPEFRRLAVAGEGDDQVVCDIEKERLRIVDIDPPDFIDRILAEGYRSFLNVRSMAGEQALGLGFFSKRPDAYSMGDVPMARRIAECISVAVSHEQLADVERQRAEARVRNEVLNAQVKSIVNATHHSQYGGGGVIGQSSAWRDVLKKATQVAATETTTLLQGESGTGKEVVARFIHRHSPRKNGPFVALNCAALPETLLESELFGYERGAFTGAHLAKPGQIELAAGGVLFLDEVSEMSSSAQAKFLRVLQEREFQRLGGTRTVKANVRVIAATNRNLCEAVEEGAFREDLFYRLQVFDIHLPPLRERRTDIPVLAAAFLDDIGRSLGRPPAELTREAKDELLAHDWPGNVRELRNALERAAILCGTGRIDREHLLFHARPSAPSVTKDLQTVERRRIEQVMRETDGNKSRAASRLGLTRTQLYVRLRKYDLERAAVA